MKAGFFTESRRDFAQKLMLNIFTVTLAAGYASNFFTVWPVPVRITVISLGLSALILGLAIEKER